MGKQRMWTSMGLENGPLALPVAWALALSTLALGAPAIAAQSSAASETESPPRTTDRERADQPTPNVQPERFFDAPVSQQPDVRSLTIELLDSGPDGTAQFLNAFESVLRERRAAGIDTANLELLRTRISAVPDTVLATLAGVDVEGPMRNAAVATGLEIMARFPSARTTRAAARLLRHVDHAGSGGVRAVSARLGTFAEITLNIRGTDSGDMVELARSALPSLATSVFDGIADANDAQLAAQTLVRTLGHAEGFDGLVLNRLERVARRSLVVLDERGYDAVRGRLRAPSAFTRREAAFACGALADTTSIGPLITLLSDPAQSVSTAAHASLKRLTSMTIAADPHRWNLWYDRQIAWWEGGGEVAVTRITRAPRSELVDLVSEVSTKRLYRDQIAEAVEGLLVRDDASTVELAIGALANLRAPRSVAALQRMSSSGGEVQRDRARAALKALQFAGVDINAARRSR